MERRVDSDSIRDTGCGCKNERVTQRGEDWTYGTRPRVESEKIVETPRNLHSSHLRTFVDSCYPTLVNYRDEECECGFTNWGASYRISPIKGII